mgnify:CR=1 FL=1
MAEDTSCSLVLFKKFHGKITKEIYRFDKGILFTDKVAKSVAFALTKILVKLSKSIIETTVGHVGKLVRSYVSDIRFVQYLHKVV